MDTSTHVVPGRDPLPRRTLQGEAVDRLRDMIVDGRLAPGARLNERALCAELGVSRTPLREAVRTLSAEGLVEIAPHRGATVTPLTVETVRQTFEVMGALESLAGDAACRNATDGQIGEIRALHFEMRACHARADLAGYFRANQAVHLALIEAAGNPVLAATYRNLNDHVKRARYLANTSRERWDAAVAEHDAMVDALDRRDGPALARLMREHLGNKMVAVLAAMAAAPSAQP